MWRPALLHCNVQSFVWNLVVKYEKNYNFALSKHDTESNFRFFSEDNGGLF